jgi:hypothetical protein
LLRAARWLRRSEPAGAKVRCGGGTRYEVGPIGDAPFAGFAFVAPELRAGVRLSQHVEVTAGVETLVLFELSDAAWDADRPVNAASDGTAYFGSESFTASVVAAFAPGVAARYEF